MTTSTKTRKNINAEAEVKAESFLDVLASRPEAQARQGNCDFSVACRLITEIAPQIKERFGDRAFSPKDFYAAICTKGYTGISKFVADACWKLAGNLTPAQQKAKQKPVHVLERVGKGLYKVA